MQNHVEAYRSHLLNLLGDKFNDEDESVVSKSKTDDYASKSLSDIDPNVEVIINVPRIIVSCDEANAPNLATPNLRIMRQDLCEGLAKDIYIIDTGNHEKQMELSERLVNMIIKGSTNNDNKEMNEVLRLVDVLHSLGKSLQLNESYDCLDIVPINFDILRIYFNDPQTGILTNYEITTVDGHSLYSTIPHDSIQEVRKRLNDTDYNRLSYMLKMCEKSLLMEPGRVYNNTINVTNICLLFIAIVNNSIPVKGRSSNDLSTHYTALLLDMLIRTRLITAWRRNKLSKSVINDMNKNYDQQNPIIKISNMQSPKERAEYILNTLKKHKNSTVQKSIMNLSYDEYIAQLIKTVCSLHSLEKPYHFYNLNAQFLQNISLMQGYTALQTLYREEQQQQQQQQDDTKQQTSSEMYFNMTHNNNMDTI